MPAEKIVVIANFLQGCSPLLSLFAYLPQWRKIIANKSSRDISLTSWLVWLVSSGIAIFYAVIQYQVTGKGTALNNGKNNRQQVQPGHFVDLLAGLAGVFRHRHLLRGDPIPGHGQRHRADTFPA